MAKDSMGLESELICPAARMLRDVLANQLPPESDPYLYLDPHPRVRLQRDSTILPARQSHTDRAFVMAQTGARGGAVVRQHKPFTDAIVFAIGGGNYVEYEQILKVVREGTLCSFPTEHTLCERCACCAERGPLHLRGDGHCQPARVPLAARGAGKAAQLRQNKSGVRQLRMNDSVNIVHLRATH